jgi:hypothetical protein
LCSRASSSWSSTPRPRRCSTSPCRHRSSPLPMSDRVKDVFFAVHESGYGTKLLRDCWAENVRSARVFQTSICSAIAMASSTSMPRYRTVLSIFVWPKAGPHAGCRCDGRSALSWCAAANGCRTAWNPVQCWRSTRRQVLHIGVSSCTGQSRGGS